jgi:hypothetical protein
MEIVEVLGDFVNRFRVRGRDNALGRQPLAQSRID